MSKKDQGGTKEKGRQVNPWIFQALPMPVDGYKGAETVLKPKIRCPYREYPMIPVFCMEYPNCERCIVWQSWKAQQKQ